MRVTSHIACCFPSLGLITFPCGCWCRSKDPLGLKLILPKWFTWLENTKKYNGHVGHFWQDYYYPKGPLIHLGIHLKSETKQGKGTNGVRSHVLAVGSLMIIADLIFQLRANLHHSRGLRVYLHHFLFRGLWVNLG